jgi:uncharacterized protein (DUF2384 family)
MATAAFEIRSLEDALAWAHDELGLTYDQIGAVLNVSERTLRRWRSHDHAPRARQRELIEDLRELRHVLAAVFPNPALRQQWLHSPEPMLRGRTPISFLRAGRIAKVVEVLATLESGAFS